MKKVLAILVAALFVFSMAAVSFAAEKAAAPAAEKKAEPAKAAPAAEKKAAPAAEKKAEPAAEKKAAVKVMQITGEVAAVDAKANTVTVKKKDKEVVLNVEKAKLDGAKAIADLKAGDKVKATYSEVDGKNVAKSISVKPAEAKKPAEEKKEEKKPAAEKKAEPAKPAAKPAEKKPAGY